MNTAKRSQVDNIIDEETHQGDTFAKVSVNGQIDWVMLEE